MSQCLIHMGFAICLGVPLPGTPPLDPSNPCDQAQELVVAGTQFATLYGGKPGWDDIVAKVLQWNDENLRKQCSEMARPTYGIPPAGIPELHVPGSG